jgi:hypothetical protein
VYDLEVPEWHKQIDWILFYTKIAIPDVLVFLNFYSYQKTCWNSSFFKEFLRIFSKQKNTIQESIPTYLPGKKWEWICCGEICEMFEYLVGICYLLGFTSKYLIISQTWPQQIPSHFLPGYLFNPPHDLKKNLKIPFSIVFWKFVGIINWDDAITKLAWPHERDLNISDFCCFWDPSFN